MIKIIINSMYYRHQFDDWLAGGQMEYEGITYHWFGQNNNYGFGWEIDPVSPEDWERITEEEFDQISSFIEKSLIKHRTEYEF